MKANNTNQFYTPICSWRKISTPAQLKEAKENFEPTESIGSSNYPKPVNFLESPTNEDEIKFNEKWVNKALFDKEEKKEEIISYLKRERSLTQAEIDRIIDFALDDIPRRVSWSSDNKKYGLWGSYASLVSIVLGLGRELIDDYLPYSLKKTIDLTYGISKGIRSYTQYSIYNRPDDDAAMNIYQADIYGNKVSGKLAQISTDLETKINPWAYAVIEMLPKHAKEGMKKLLSMPTALWWRSRMPAHINQPFFTDFLEYMLHKPLSLFGIKSSKDRLKETNISPSYVWERHCKNIGLKDKKEHTFKNFISEFSNHIKNMFNKDPTIQGKSSKKIAETIAPGLGMYGFFAILVGNIGSSIMKFFKKEGKIFDFISASGNTSQQIIYLPKLFFPMRCEGVKLEKEVENKKKECTEEERENFKQLAKEKKNLANWGFTAFGFNIGNIIFKLVKVKNPILKKLKNMVDELAGSIPNRFFSHRRHLMGLQFELENPEFYETEEAKEEIVSGSLLGTAITVNS